MFKLATPPSKSKVLRWQRSQYSLFARQMDIIGAAIQLIFGLWWDQYVAGNSPTQRQRRAQWLTQLLLDLGPTFIKIGQALSTRADLLPLEYIQGLGQLQDRVPEFSGQEAIALVESELGSSITALYREFERYPIAAASLGQVHRAILHTGEAVVVKVQRPGLEKLFNLDFQVLHRLVRFSQRYLPWTRRYELEAIYNEFFNLLYQEIDYIQEGKNAERFATNFQKHQNIKVPKVFWRYTTTKILTVEYMPGIKISDRKTLESCGMDLQRINQLGICSYLKQLLQDGFFQADPHPGNMAVAQDGSLIFYDFGMMLELQGLAREQMIQTFFAVLRKDTDEVVDTLMEMGLIVPVSDMTPIKRLITFMLDKFTEKPIDVQAFSEMKSEIYAMFQQQPFRLPAQMTFIIKALTTLDGIARTLDPQYNLVASAKPFIRSLTVQGKGGMVGELTRQAREFVRYKLNQPKAAEVLIHRLEERIERGELQFRIQNDQSDRLLKRIQLGIKSLIYACLTGFSCLTGAVLLLGNYSHLAIFPFVASGVFGFVLFRHLIDLMIKEKLDKLAAK